MASTLVTNIKLLVNTRFENKLLRGKELSVLPCVENAFLLIEDGFIASFGEMDNLDPVNEVADH
ncbi:MAG: imidazolonepropionase, partial [Chitinophagaceae bacterium]|nr:imidazolonepropionase [Chitinophagaceae bacterium]